MPDANDTECVAFWKDLQVENQQLRDHNDILQKKLRLIYAAFVELRDSIYSGESRREAACIRAEKLADEAGEIDDGVDE